MIKQQQTLVGLAGQLRTALARAAEGPIAGLIPVYVISSAEVTERKAGELQKAIDELATSGQGDAELLLKKVAEASAEAQAVLQRISMQIKEAVAYQQSC